MPNQPDQLQWSRAHAAVAASFDGQCFNCGDETDGSQLFFWHLPLCDACLMRSVIRVVGKPLAARIIVEPPPMMFNPIDVFEAPP